MFKELNPLLHSELRLAVMSILIGVESADFVFIRQQTGATAGNLSVQLDKLAKADYIEIEKTFRGKMPCTVCRITDTGRDAFAESVAALQTYIKRSPRNTLRRNAALVAGPPSIPAVAGTSCRSSGKSIPEGHPYPNLNRKIYIVQKNVTRNGTLKSSTQPWKTDTTA